MAFASLNIFSGIVKLCRAGHPSPAIARKSGQVEFVGEPGAPIGMLPDAKYTTTRLQLSRGDGLMLYSDGIADFADAEGHDEKQALGKLVQACAQARAAEFGSVVLEQLRNCHRGTALTDDISALYVEFRK